MRRLKRVLLILVVLSLPLMLALTAGRIVTTYILFEDFNTFIRTDTADEIEFGVVANEDISLNLATSNTLTLTSDSGVVNLAFGDVDALTGIESLTGEGTGISLGFRLGIETVVADDTLTTAESGKVFVVWNDTDGISLTLPAVGATDDGCYFIIVDANEVAASDVTVEPGTGDSINGAAADVGFSSDGADEVPCGVTLIYHHATTDWLALTHDLTTAWDSDGA